MKGYVLIIACIMIISCTGSHINKNNNRTSRVLSTEEKELFNIIKSHNQRTPESIYTSFSLFGKIKKKKFKSFGTMKYSKSLGRFEATFKDIVFYSIITKVYMNKNDVILYFPIDKTVILDKKNTMNMRNYLNLSIPLHIITELTSGKIPMIKNYKIKKGVKRGTSRFLILENKSFYQVISFKNNKTDKIKILNKKTNDQYEIYLNKLYRKQNTVFYKNILIKASKGSMSLNLKFKRILYKKNINFNSYERLLKNRGLKIRRFY